MGVCPSFLRPIRSTTLDALGESPHNGDTIPTSSTENPVQLSTVPEHSPRLEELEIEIREKLRDLEIPDSGIILPQKLEELWYSTYHRKFYSRWPWFNEKWDLSNGMREYNKIISILILARFTGWDKFEEIFITGKRNDTGLPFPKSELERTDFLGRDFGPNFWKEQWAVCPLVIKEQQDPYKLTGDLANQKLPYLGKPKPIGDGATGDVYEQEVAARHIQFSERGDLTENVKSKKIACKIVKKNRIEPIEFENLITLRSETIRHSRIMVNIATIVQEDQKLGELHVILYDLAAYDLYEHLHNGILSSNRFDPEEDHRNDRARRHDSAGPKRNNSHQWWAGDLLQESRHLADALRFLHDELELVHNDLKPDNILVFYPNSSRADETYPVGQWKIADFGLAKIKKRSDPAKGHHLHPGPQDIDKTHRRKRSAEGHPPSLTPAKRDPGKYTAPDVRAKNERIDAKAADVWGFGCILAEVFACAVAPHLMKELEQELEKPLRIDQRFYDINTWKVKESFQTWLNDLPGRCKGSQAAPPWIQKCVDLINSILVDDPSSRKHAWHITTELDRIARSMERQHQWHVEDRALSSSSSPADPDCDSSGDSTGLSEDRSGTEVGTPIPEGNSRRNSASSRFSDRAETYGSPEHSNLRPTPSNSSSIPKINVVDAAGN
ncbi:kinase-like protein [Lophiostoma macrostomum CBS 122681]|uniref:Kinase-like protein n=1 Tax=Lophiostoma macrostomum CBS 122681 TaxID=1314788 RepID=A0A6A6SKS2_9PLEO|nr:kinase-like protein [Lophiostoma macrostomum CBS 122681]